MKYWPRSGAALALLLTITLAGCSESRSEIDVTGKITLEGEPIPRGTITFLAADGNTPVGGGVIQDGTYTAKVLPGDKVVLVLGNKLVGQEPQYAGVPDSPLRNKYETLTHPAYNAKRLTPLKATITDATTSLDFDLEKRVSTRRR